MTRRDADPLTLDEAGGDYLSDMLRRYNPPPDGIGPTVRWWRVSRELPRPLPWWRRLWRRRG